MPDEQGNQGQGEPGQDGGETPENWEQFLEGQPEGVRTLYEAHTQGLRSALQSEREQRSDLARQLREATGQLEEGSEAREALERLNGQLESAQRRADFYEEAARPEIGCTNPRLAFLGAQEVEAFDRRGNVNWERLKEQFPELFGQSRTPPANAGSGTGSDAPRDFDINAAIRAATGRR